MKAFFRLAILSVFLFSALGVNGQTGEWDCTSCDGSDAKTTSSGDVELKDTGGKIKLTLIGASGGSSYNEFVMDDNGSSNNWRIQYRTDTERMWQVQSYDGTTYKAPLKIEHGATGNSLYIDANGDIGLGTSSPNAVLDVRGDAVFNEGGADNDFRIEGDGNSNLFFVDASADAIGIGTTTLKSGYAVSVDGKIACEELKVENSSNWPDFVFKKDYGLMSLGELATFIEKNSHLPNVPSAKEVEANGISVGEMQTTLLRKVEELTLYVLQLNDQNEQLKTQIELLKNDSK